MILPTNRNEYVKAQAKCNFKAGEKVKVLSSATSHARGWENSWTPAMDKYIGKILVVEGNPTEPLPEMGVRLACPEDNTFRFPFFVLERVTEVAPVTAAQPDNSGKFITKAIGKAAFGIQQLSFGNIRSAILCFESAINALKQI